MKALQRDGCHQRRCNVAKGTGRRLSLSEPATSFGKLALIVLL
jgi:hypothetical protein